MVEDNHDLLPASVFPYDSSNVLLGRGGSGAVFLAKHHDTMDLIAVKRCYRCNTHRKNRTSNGKRPTRPLISSASGAAGGDRTKSCSHLISQRQLERNAFENEEDMREESNMEVLSLSQQGEPPSQCVNPQWDENDRVHAEGTEASSEVNEVTILESLSPHPHIVRYLGKHTSCRNVTFFAMELMNSDIAREVSQGSLAFMREDVCTVLIYSILLALDHLHRNGIAHRDVKPGNILLKRVSANKTPGALPIPLSTVAPGEEVGMESSDDVSWVRATLGDFSAAHFRAQSGIDTDLLATRGTLHYKAPEQLMGKRIVSFSACDMWALGCTIFEIFTGKLAFPGTSELQVQLQIFKQLGSSFSEFPAQNPNPALFESTQASPVFVNFLKRLLVLDPAQRCTAEEALQHPLFARLNTLRNLKEASNPTTQATFISFPLKLLYAQLPDINTLKVRFRPVAWTPLKRQRTKVGFASEQSSPQTQVLANLTPFKESSSKRQSWDAVSNISDANSLHWSQVRSHPNHTPVMSIEAVHERKRISGSPDMYFQMPVDGASDAREESQRVARRLSVLTKSLRSSPQEGVARVDRQSAEAFLRSVSLEATPVSSGLDAPTRQLKQRGMVMALGTSLIAGNQRATQEFELLTRQGHAARGRPPGEPLAPRLSVSASRRPRASAEKWGSPPSLAVPPPPRRGHGSPSRSPEPLARKALCFESPRLASESMEPGRESAEGAAAPGIGIGIGMGIGVGLGVGIGVGMGVGPGVGIAEAATSALAGRLSAALLRTPSRSSGRGSPFRSASASPVVGRRERLRGRGQEALMPPPPLPLSLSFALPLGRGGEREARWHGSGGVRETARPQRHCTPSVDPHDTNPNASEPRGRSVSNPPAKPTPPSGETLLTNWAEGASKRVRVEGCI